MKYVILTGIFAALSVIFAIFSLVLYKKLKKNSLFLSTVAHDMRAPLAAICGFAQLILERPQDRELQEKALAVISMESERLSTTASRLCRGKKLSVNKSVFGICDMLARLEFIMQNEAARKNTGISVKLELPDDEIYVHADSDAIFEALFNIANNAVKYCKDGGTVLIFAENCEDRAKILILNDSLPPSDGKFDGKKLFSPHFRGKNTNNISGSGLGLYVSNEIIKAHGKKLNASYSDGVFEMSFYLDIIK
ncbi:MAG: HAMP domain-containing histidine kinase [Clostridia bacterium]|nr:HAMP domain-containing histidine kinase [Clostridia bacterium]